MFNLLVGAFVVTVLAAGMGIPDEAIRLIVAWIESW